MWYIIKFAYLLYPDFAYGFTTNVFGTGGPSLALVWLWFLQLANLSGGFPTNAYCKT